MIFTRVGAVTVNVVCPLIVPRVAEIDACPADIASAEPEASIVATFGADVAHVTELVKTALLPSEYFPVATNCCVVPATTVEFAGVTEIELRTAAVT